jgi:hypothetical protein
VRKWGQGQKRTPAAAGRPLPVCLKKHQIETFLASSSDGGLEQVRPHSAQH